MGYEFDTSEWPIVRFTFIDRLSVAETERYFEDADKLVHGTRSYACVMDGTDMLLPETPLVRRQALWIHANGEAMQRVVRAIAFITPSALVRGVVRAVLHFQTIPVPYASFSDLEEGVAWAREQMRAPDVATSRRD